MELKTAKVRLNKSQQETFDFLLNMENYEQLMPEDTRKFEVHESGEGFSVGIGNLPNIGLRLKETEAPTKIVFESPSEEFEYYFRLNITEVEAGVSEVELDFEGKFNAILEMMTKKPLTNFVETISSNLAKVLS